MSAAGPLAANGGAGLRSRLSPESVALGIIVIVTVAVSLPSIAPRLSFGGGPGANPVASLPLLTPPPESRYDTGSAGLVLELDRLIGQSEQPLKEALAKRQLDPTAIRSELSRIVVNVRLGLDVAARLQARAESRKLGEHVAGYYEGLRAIADRSFKAALANEAAHRRAAEDMIAALDKRRELDLELKAFLKKAEADQLPASPSPVPSPSAPAAIASPSASASASSGTGGTPGDVVVNGSFEDGPTPWRLSFRDPAAIADSSVDRAQARVGQASLRIEINAGSDSRSGIAIEQSGLAIVGDSRYLVRLFAQTERPREIRVAILSSSGATFGGRVFDVGTTWTALEFEFTALRSDDNARLEVDLGRSTETVWLDAITVLRQAN
jgi:hypothetical protein